jgi:uncharacterized protein (DUF2336 family)
MTAMSGFSSLIDELEQTIASGTAKQRQKALAYVTELFVTGSRHYSSEQTALFDDVLLRLADAIEEKARAQLSERLAGLAHAPPKVVRSLAFDDAITVAGPVLIASPQLSEQDLVANASTKSQDHLYAIAQRPTLSEAVTDVLVDRGDQRVVRSVAKNGGARFSDNGFGKLVTRARTDEMLAQYLGERSDLPRPHFLKLLKTASASVRIKLEAASPHAAAAVRDLVAEIADGISEQVREASSDHAKAKADAKRRYGNSQLSERDVHARARAQEFEKTVVALALLGHYPVDLVERALLDEGPDMVLILAKAAQCSRTTAKAILLMHAAGRGMSAPDLERALASYERLSTKTAKQVLEFYTERRKSRSEGSEPANAAA